MRLPPVLAMWQALVGEVRRARVAGRAVRVWFYARDTGVFLIQ